MKTSILTHSELEWLTGLKIVSAGYERKIKSDIKCKIKIFQEIELPLLIEKGFVSNHSVTPFSNSSVTEYSNANLLSPKIEHRKVLRPGFEPGIVALRGRNA